MKQQVITITESDSLAMASRLLAQRGIRHLPVCRGTDLVGIISDRDIWSANPSLLNGHADRDEFLTRTHVSDCMITDVITTGPDAPLEEVARVMSLRRIGCVPILEADRLVGILTESDILNAFADLLGVHEPAARLELEIPNRPAALGQLLNFIAEEYGVSLVSALLAPESGGAPQRLVLRLATVNLSPILAGLRREGYRVLWPHAEALAASVDY